MELQESLHTIAEIAVALAGFSGVVVVFTSTRNNWGVHELASLAVMLRASFTAMFLSFVPVLVWHMGYEEQVWRITATVIATVMTTNISLFIWQTKWVEASWTQRTNAMIGVLLVLVMLAAATENIPRPEVVVLFGLLWTLFIAAHNFWLLLGRGFDEGDT